MDGKTILGGIFGGYLAVEIAKSRLGIKVGTGDAFAIPIAIAVMIGRVGCFWAGCCYGTITELPWGVAFPNAGDANGVLRHPTQLYEGLFHGVAILLLVLGERRAWIPGQRLKAYLLAYLAYRFLTEWIRPETHWWLGLTVYQLACIGLSLILVGLWYRDEQRLNRESPSQGLSA
jgi:prolipoprotein diacylglyceryltransferase